MKPTFKYMVQGYSGKCDGLIYYYNKKLRRTICRKIGKYQHREQHDRLKAISQNLRNLDPSEGYKNDLELYVIIYSNSMSNRSKVLTSWYSAYTMLMWAMAKEYDLDLATLSREQLANDNLPCLTVQRAVEAGLLPHVHDYEIMYHSMFS